MKKSPGPGDITTEMLVGAGDIGITELTKLANMMYPQGSFANELNKSIFVALPNVNNGKTPHNQLDESCDQVSASHCNQQN